MANTPDGPSAPLDDTALMRRVQAGDEEAFAQLLYRWEVPVKAAIARLVLNSAEAEDLAQETFVRLWQTRHRFAPDRLVKPWILSIALNLARNRLRWWRRRPRISLEEWSGLPPDGPDRTDGGDLEHIERAAAVRDAVAALPWEYREALVLFEYEGLSVAEIAAAVGATPKAVERRLARAREKLRAALRRWL